MKGRLLLTSLIALSLLAPDKALAAPLRSTSAIQTAERAAESQVRNLLDPLLAKYCPDECKLMSVTASVDLTAAEEVAPGFDEVDPRGELILAPSSAKAKLLIDERVGPVSRRKLLELMQQFLDTLDFPVRIDTQITHFPQPIGSAGKIAELREKVTKQFKGTIESLFNQFCPQHCLLADYELDTEAVNAEEAQWGSSGEFMGDAGVAIRIKGINGTVLIDEALSPEERANILEMAKLRTNYFKNVNLASRAMRFPRPVRTDPFGNLIYTTPPGVPIAGAAGKENKSESETLRTESSSNTTQNNADVRSQTTSTNSSDNKSSSSNETKSNNLSQETNQRQERFERFEKIERVENGDAVQKELEKFKVFGLIFACSVLALLIFLAMATFRIKLSGGTHTIQKVLGTLGSDPVTSPDPALNPEALTPVPEAPGTTSVNRNATVLKRYEIERLQSELMDIFAQQPKVAKYVFSRVLTEDGVEITAQYVYIFGESVVMDMIRDPSLQSDMNELMEFYAKTTFDLTDDERLELLKRLHNRTVAGKLLVMGSRSSHLFDFLSEMDGPQILELIRNESLTGKSIVLTQCDPQKRAAIYSQLDDNSRFQLMTELSRIDYLPRDYIFNVANALKRKRRDNPRLNTEALPGSDVLLTLLERTSREMQRTVIRNLELSNPDSARSIKGKLVSLDTLRFLRDGQLLEVVLSLKHEELLQFLKGLSEDLRHIIFAKSPRDLVADLEEELASMGEVNREAYHAIERKVVNRMKLMANDGLINLVETNERMLAEAGTGQSIMEAGPAEGTHTASAVIRKVGGW